MKITSEALISDALRLRKSQDEMQGAREAGKRSVETQTRIKDTLGEINLNLKSHQKTIARLQLENIGLERIEQNLDQLQKQHPVEKKLVDQATDEIKTVLEATRYQQEQLIPKTIKDLFKEDLSIPDNLLQAKESVSLRRDTISGKLQMEFSQISKIQVSFENILSQQIPATDSVGGLIKDIKKQMTIQDKIQSNVNPATVMGLLQE